MFPCYQKVYLNMNILIKLTNWRIWSINQIQYLNNAVWIIKTIFLQIQILILILIIFNNRLLFHWKNRFYHSNYNKDLYHSHIKTNKWIVHKILVKIIEKYNFILLFLITRYRNLRRNRRKTLKKKQVSKKNYYRRLLREYFK